jgi:hypothetical protein
MVKVVEDIHVLLSSFRSWQVEYVKKELNEPVHRLAMIAENAGVANIWMEETPHCIDDIVVLEQAALVV